MSKSKYQKLADAMRQMLDQIEEHYEKVERELDMVQFHVSEKVLIDGRPLLPQSKLAALMDTHRIGLIHFSSDEVLRSCLMEKPFVGAIVALPPEIKQPIMCRLTKRYLVPWKVSIILPKGNCEGLSQMRYQTLLYCPAPREISKELNWFESEDAASSLIHQILTEVENDRRSNVVNENLRADSFPIWEESIKKWQCIPGENTDSDFVNEVAAAAQNLDKMDFAPHKGLSLAAAYEKVMKSIRARQSKHRHRLRTTYKEHLEAKIFDNVPWSDHEKDLFLKQWQSRVFGDSERGVKPKPGRWKQCESVSRETAARLIEYFVNQFISDPSNKKAGEIACVLWVRIWIAQQDKSSQITLTDVLKLSSTNLKPGKIIFDNIEVSISWGLHHFLDILCGEGEGIRSRRLFENLDIEGKALERALIRASKAIFGENELPVLPGAFLGFPHRQPNQRMPIAKRQALRKIKPIIPLRYTHTEVKKALLEISKPKKA
jgi:hypothetical protein